MRLCNYFFVAWHIKILRYSFHMYLSLYKYHASGYLYNNPLGKNMPWGKNVIVSGFLYMEKFINGLAVAGCQCQPIYELLSPETGVSASCQAKNKNRLHRGKLK